MHHSATTQSGTEPTQRQVAPASDAATRVDVVATATRTAALTAPPGKKAEQSEATRHKLLQVSRKLFATRGYADASIAEIVDRAKVTRGALYHHFESKQDVFRGVYEDLQRELAERFYEAAMKESKVGKRLEVGCEAFLDACLDRGLQRIVLVDSPSVLGWDYWHEIDEKYSLGQMQDALRAGMKDGYFERQPVEPLAQVLFGALNEAGLYIARAENPEAARKEVGKTVLRLIAGLRPKGARK
jgi:AcrR family transcriptional regulator